MRGRFALPSAREQYRFPRDEFMRPDRRGRTRSGRARAARPVFLAAPSGAARIAGSMGRPGLMPGPLGRVRPNGGTSVAASGPAAIPILPAVAARLACVTARDGVLGTPHALSERAISVSTAALGLRSTDALTFLPALAGGIGAVIMLGPSDCAIGFSSAAHFRPRPIPNSRRPGVRRRPARRIRLAVRTFEGSSRGEHRPRDRWPWRQGCCGSMTMPIACGVAPIVQCKETMDDEHR